MILSRYTPFLLAMLALLVGLTSARWIDWRLAVILAANGFFIAYISLTLTQMRMLKGSYLSKHAASSDAPVLLAFVLTIGTVMAAITSLFFVVNADKPTVPYELGLALVSVPLGWATIHLMAAAHYAHLFWQPPKGDGTPRKGLQFPDDSDPEGWDFVYFAFVIGMAAQTSDVAITSRHMRKFALAHSVLAFFFNTVLVAAAVNVAVALGG